MEALRELLGRYGALAWRRRWWAMLVAWVVCIVGWITIALLPNQYEANARVFIDADAFLTPLLKGIAVESSLQDELDLLQHMLLSRPNLERIIAKTDLQAQATTPYDTERLVESLEQRIKVVAQTRNIFSITLRDRNRQLASDVVQAMLASFIENKAGDNREQIDRASSFIDTQIAQYERQLRDAEQKRAAFRKKYIDLLPGDGGTSRLEQARNQVSSLEGRLEDARTKRQLLAQQLATTPPTLGSEGGGSVENPELREAENRLHELRQVYTDEYPEVISQKRLVEQLRAGGGSGDEGGRARIIANPTYQEFRLQFVETEAEIASLQRQVQDARADRDRLEKIARGVPELEAQYTNLNRDYDIVRKNYDELVSRREGMRISEAAQKKASNIKMVILDPPTVPRVPVAPARGLLALGVLVLGLGAAGGAVAAMMALDQSFHTVVELRSLGLPVIGSVSLAALAPTLRERLRQIGMFAGAFALLLLALGGVLMRFAGPA
ncbi:MAG TPA: XrtA system polysaccharide chain length determinant [Acetobacteraceae bacterium]|nr:XrtA system polysaccharide chain length determinant [Acetobacteraceae bacterium]